MKTTPSRRDFLKLAGLLPASLALQHASHTANFQSDRQNVLVIVFDAFSAFNISLYGYGRKTTPNLDRLAKRAIVYHNHHASSSFTTPGTASILTGTLPWTHRALEPKGEVIEPYVTRNFFGAFKNYYRISYTHNTWANTILKQLHGSIDEPVPLRSLFINKFDSSIPSIFAKDSDIATVAWTRNNDRSTSGYSYSLFWSRLYEALVEMNTARLKQEFPRGLPSTGGLGNEFILQRGIDWVARRLARLPQPFTGYFHFLPPHAPYNTSLKFYNSFAGDGFNPREKPVDMFSRQFSNKALLQRRLEYDEFILYVDEEFGRFFRSLESSGLLDNTWVVLTSDHGEMHERGISGHSTFAMYDPVVRVPLMIFEPGRTTGEDIHTPTSAVDLLPTMLHVTGQPAPDWSDGVILPPFSDSTEHAQRSIYAVKSGKGSKDDAIRNASVIIVKDKYKLLYYFNEQEGSTGDFVRLFDLKSDREELNDLAAAKPDLTSEMLHEVKQKLAEVNQPYL